MSTTITKGTEEAASPMVVLKDKTAVPTTFNYWGSTSTPQESELHQIFTGASSGLRSVPSFVSDLRVEGLSSVDLSTHGFQVLQHSSSLLPPQSPSIPDFHDASFIKANYWPELMSLLKSQLGVRSAVPINTTVRDVARTREEDFDANNPRPAAKDSLQPFFIAHGDYTAPGARAHLRAMAPSFFKDNGAEDGVPREEREEFFRLRGEILEAEDKAMREEGVSDQWAWSGGNYAGPRWAMLSVWRPFETVRRDPLAVLDPRSLFEPGTETPYVPIQRVYRDRPGFEKEFRSENMLAVAPGEGRTHRWYYISDQEPEEVYALKLFDSEAHRRGSDVAQCVVHSAFSRPDEDQEEARRSAEVRALVVW